MFGRWGFRWSSRPQRPVRSRHRGGGRTPQPDAVWPRRPGGRPGRSCRPGRSLADPQPRWSWSTSRPRLPRPTPTGPTGRTPAGTPRPPGSGAADRTPTPPPSPDPDPPATTPPRHTNTPRPAWRRSPLPATGPVRTDGLDAPEDRPTPTTPTATVRAPPPRWATTYAKMTSADVASRLDGSMATASQTPQVTSAPHTTPSPTPPNPRSAPRHRTLPRP